jgi:hypothetical protein
MLEQMAKRNPDAAAALACEIEGRAPKPKAMAKTKTRTRVAGLAPAERKRYLHQVRTATKIVARVRAADPKAYDKALAKVRRYLRENP